MPDFTIEGNLPNPYTMYTATYKTALLHQKEENDRMSEGLAISQAIAGYPHNYPNASYGLRAKAAYKGAAKALGTKS